MRTRLWIALGVCLSLPSLAQSAPEAKGRYVRVRTTVRIAATRARVDGKWVQIPARDSSMEQWVWVAEGQPLPPNAIPERSRTDVVVPAVTIPDVVIP